MTRLEDEYLYPYGRIECPLSRGLSRSRDDGTTATTTPSLLLKRALWHGDLIAVRRAVRDGASQRVSRTGACPFETPLLAALWLGHEDIAAFLLPLEERRRSSTATGGVRRRCCLRREFAVACGEPRISLRQIRMLVHHLGPDLVHDDDGDDDPSTDRTDDGGSFTPLHYASYRGHWPLMEYLLSVPSVGRRDDGRPRSAAWTTPATRHRVTPLHTLRCDPRRPHDGDLLKCLARILSSSSSRPHDDGDADDDMIGRDALLTPDARGITALQSVLQHADTETRSYCVTWWITRMK